MERHAAEAALGYIRDDMTIGLGSGKAVEYLIEFISMQHFKNLKVVTNNMTTALAASERELTLVPSSMVTKLDYAFDSLDLIFDDLTGTKNDPAAALQDQLLAAMADHFVMIADRKNYGTVLTEGYPLQVEVVPQAFCFVAEKLKAMGGDVVTLHSGNNNPQPSINGNYILYVNLKDVKDPAKTKADINAILGVVANSIFDAKDPIALIYEGKDVEVVRRDI